MYCKHCGLRIDDPDTPCPYCGIPFADGSTDTLLLRIRQEVDDPTLADTLIALYRCYLQVVYLDPECRDFSARLETILDECDNHTTETVAAIEACCLRELKKRKLWRCECCGKVQSLGQTVCTACGGTLST